MIGSTIDCTNDPDYGEIVGTDGVFLPPPKYCYAKTTSQNIFIRFLLIKEPPFPLETINII